MPSANAFRLQLQISKPVPPARENEWGRKNAILNREIADMQRKLMDYDRDRMNESARREEAS